MKAEDKPSTSPFDPADLLENGDMILGYLTNALASDDPAFIDDALDVALRAAKRLEAAEATVQSTRRMCPSCGEQMLRDVRNLTVEHRERAATLTMPRWHCDACDACGEGVHSGEDMVASDAVLERLRAELQKAFSADEPSFETLNARQVIDRNRK